MADNRRNTTRFILVIAVTIVVAVSCFKFFAADTSSNHLDAAKRAFERQDYAAACEHVQRHLQQMPRSEDALIIGAEAAQRCNDLELALEFLQQLPARFDKAEQIQWWRTRARILKHFGRITESCAVLENILEHVPDDLVARRWLCQTLSECGFEFEAIQHARLLLQRRAASISELALLARNGHGRISRSQLNRWHSQNPNDQMSVVGLLRSAESERNAAETSALLSDADTRFDNPIVQLKWCQLEFAVISDSSGEQREVLLADLQRLHHRDGLFSRAWLITADWAKAAGQPELHQSCLTTAVRMDRWNAAAIHGLANALRDHDAVLSQRFFDLFQQLQQIQSLASQAEVSPEDTDRIRAVATRLADLGRTDEASAWTRLARIPNAQAAWAAEMTTNPPLARWRHPIEDVALVDATAMLTEQRIMAAGQTKVATDDVIMNECAKEVGLKFEYINGQTSEQQGLKMHQWTGGGIGVVDFDHDSWPDLYLSQGVDLNALSQTGSESDALFRNLRGASFVAAAQTSGLYETGYGQGVAVGDINQDGFDDIYVGNVGVNRLLMNQGDGTFISTDVAVGDAVWTTSVAIADVNQDTVPDLYDVNYLRGQDVFTKTCDHSGLQRICGPTDFAAEPDRLLLSDATGGYSVAPNFPVGSDGRGMGVLIGAITGEAGSQIYVANDESANQLFISGLGDEGHNFLEAAATAGLAFDYYGRSQGSMGIASGDVDNNGRLDLFVTNYYAEQNTLYQQQSSSFLDETSPAGLAGPGYSQLGFGCQFLDIQSNGLLDLVIANGHLDDFTHEGQPYRMLPQVFLNAPAGVFQSVQPASEFFRTPSLGRAVAKVDWNGDGRCDLTVGHLDQPVALITNQTPAMNPIVTVQLVGTTSSRSAVGTVMFAAMAKHRQTRWLTAGDGYQCSNERLVRFAVPTQPAVWTVKWPDGQQQTVSELAPGMHCVIQGRSTTYLLTR